MFFKFWTALVHQEVVVTAAEAVEEPVTVGRSPESP
jgi:hypothetical protein